MTHYGLERRSEAVEASCAEVTAGMNPAHWKMSIHTFLLWNGIYHRDVYGILNELIMKLI